MPCSALANKSLKKRSKNSKKHAQKLQFIDRTSIQIKNEIRDFLRACDIKLIMSHRNFTTGKLFLYDYNYCQSLLQS